MSNTAGSSDAAFDLDLQYVAAAASTEVPTVPTSVTSSATTSSITVSWKKPTCDGSSFVIRYDLTSVSGLPATSATVTDPFNANAYRVTFPGLKGKTKYTVAIAAVNAAGASTPASITVTTK